MISERITKIFGSNASDRPDPFNLRIDNTQLTLNQHVLYFKHMLAVTYQNLPQGTLPTSIVSSPGGPTTFHINHRVMSLRPGDRPFPIVPWSEAPLMEFMGLWDWDQ
jgi:hypothetical protein